MNDNRKKMMMAVHGAGMHAGIWGGVVSGLDSSCDAISFPGHGGVEGELLSSIEEMSLWLSNKLDDHGEGSVILMGHSMGSLAALDVAGHKAVCAVVLLGSSALMPVAQPLLDVAKQNPEEGKVLILKYGIYKDHPQLESVRTAVARQMGDVNPEALFNDLRACNNYTNGEIKARQLDKPALVIAGSEDKLTSAENGKALADLMPKAEFHLMERCGHMMMFEKSAETAQIINSFIAGLE